MEQQDGKKAIRSWHFAPHGRAMSLHQLAGFLREDQRRSQAVLTGLTHTTAMMASVGLEGDVHDLLLRMDTSKRHVATALGILMTVLEIVEELASAANHEEIEAATIPTVVRIGDVSVVEARRQAQALSTGILLEALEARWRGDPDGPASGFGRQIRRMREDLGFVGVSRNGGGIHV